MSNNQTVLDGQKKWLTLLGWGIACTRPGLNLVPPRSLQNKASVFMGPSIEKHVNINSSQKGKEKIFSCLDNRGWAQCPCVCSFCENQAQSTTSNAVGSCVRVTNFSFPDFISILLRLLWPFKTWGLYLLFIIYFMF